MLRSTLSPLRATLAQRSAPTLISQLQWHAAPPSTSAALAFSTFPCARNDGKKTDFPSGITTAAEGDTALGVQEDATTSEATPAFDNRSHPEAVADAQQNGAQASSSSSPSPAGLFAGSPHSATTSSSSPSTSNWGSLRRAMTQDDPFAYTPPSSSSSSSLSSRMSAYSPQPLTRQELYAEQEALWAKRPRHGVPPVTPVTGRTVLVRGQDISGAWRNLGALLGRNGVFKQYREQKFHKPQSQKKRERAYENRVKRFRELVRQKVRLATQVTQRGE